MVDSLKAKLYLKFTTKCRSNRIDQIEKQAHHCNVNQDCVNPLFDQGLSYSPLSTKCQELIKKTNVPFYLFRVEVS